MNIMIASMARMKRTVVNNVYSVVMDQPLFMDGGLAVDVDVGKRCNPHYIRSIWIFIVAMPTCYIGTIQLASLNSVYFKKYESCRKYTLLKLYPECKLTTCTGFEAIKFSMHSVILHFIRLWGFYISGTCDDGTKILRVWNCDAKWQCKDGKDEEGCGKYCLLCFKPQHYLLVGWGGGRGC